MTMPGRNYNAGTGYRYGFNGKENDKDISEGGQDYGMRIYDSRLGKFLSVDPITDKFPWYSPYQYAGNKPIWCIDLDGLEETSYTFYYQSQRNTKVKHLNTNKTSDSKKSPNLIININLDGKRYLANSYQTLKGRDDRYMGINDFSSIKTLSNNNLAGILGYADFVFDEVYARRFKEDAVLTESNAGPFKSSSNLLDFKNILYNLFDFKRDELIQIDGTVYNANEAGNYLWAMVLTEAGVIVNPSLIAKLGSKNFNDEIHEQKAIKAGISKANSFLKKGSLSNEVREKVKNIYTEDYYGFKADGGGHENYVPPSYLEHEEDN